jgi:hypothetical protein
MLILGPMRIAALVSLAAIAAAVVCSGEGKAVGRQAPTPPRCAAVPPYRVVSAPPRYRLRFTIPRSGPVTGTEWVTFRAPRATNRIVFRLWANAPITRAGGAQLTAHVVVMPTGARVEESADATTLTLRLAQPLQRNQIAVVELRFAVQLPPPRGIYRIARGPGYVRLGSFFPLLALDADGSWATDPPSNGAAETWVSPAAQFDARITAPSGWSVVATGTSLDGGRWHADSVRDFAVVASTFARSGAVALARRPVRVTAVATDAAVASAFANRAARALEKLAALYGAYPWPRYNVAVFDDLGRSGIEYPNIVFQGTGSLDRATAHEAAHQWFYSLVGNNQARDPWLDESLASWAMTRVDPVTQAIDAYPIPDSVHGKLTQPMSYWDTVPKDYFAGVYAQGYQAFASLGDPGPTDCALRLYVARNAFGIARPPNLMKALADRLPPDAIKRFAAYG